MFHPDAGDEDQRGPGAPPEEVFLRKTLAEGLTLHVLPTSKFKTITVRLVVRRNLQADEAAANACIPFVLRRGSRSYPDSRSIARFLEDLFGAQFFVDSLKVGETQVLELALEVAADRYVSGREQLLRKGLAFLGDIFLHPLEEAGGFKKSFVAREVDVLKRRIEGIINDKPAYALERLRQLMCPDEPFGLHRYGSVEALDRLNPQGLYEHYQRLLRQSPIDIFVVGDVAPQEVEEWVREALPIPRGSIEAMRPPLVRFPTEVREIQEEEEVHQAILAVGYRTPLRYPDDGYEGLLMYNGILGGFPHSKLFINVREKASLAYFAASRLDGTKGVLVAFAGIDPERYGQARTILERQVEDMAAGRITEEEMQAARNSLIHGLRTVGDSADRLIHHELVGLVNGRVRRPQETMDALQGVTVDQVAALAADIALDTVYFLTRGAPREGAAVGAAAEAEESQEEEA